MDRNGNPGARIFTGTVRKVFGFFFFLGRRTGKTRMFFVLGLLPAVLSIVVKLTVNPRSGEVASVFTEILMVFFLQFYIVILALFFGTSIAAEEVEGRTLPYLLTRPLSKPGVVVGKAAAYVWLMFLMVVANTALSYFIINAGRLGDPSLYGRFAGYAAVLLLGVVAYTAFFTFLGVFLKRAILVGLAFGFGWENVIQFFPGSTQKFSIVHYLKSLLPYSPGGGAGRLTILLFRLEPSGTGTSIVMLLLITVVFLGLACALFRWKEYLPGD